MIKMGKKAFKRGLVLLLVLTLLLSFSAANLLAAPGFLNPGGTTSEAGGKVDVLVGFHGQPSREVIVKAGGEIYTEFTIVNVIAASMAPGAADALARNPRISYVELDAPVYAVETATVSSTQTVPWGIDRVFGPESYSFSTWKSAKGSGIGVAVLDTGIDGSHEDLPKLSGGITTVDGTHHYVDDNSHGTHVAGTIAALDNNLGVVGVSPQVNLYAVKVLNASGSGTMSTVTEGVQWAVAQEGIKVINMSLSGGYSQTLHDACNAAYNNGHLLVAAAGNSGMPSGRGDNVGYPAAYESVIAVAASDGSDNRARFSSTGPAVELIAPGVSILSTIPGDGYGTKSGTSMASPHVAGVAALVWSAKPELTSAGLRTVLQETAEDLGLIASHQGYGLVRADLAVAAVLGEPVGPVIYTVSVTANPAEGGTVSGGGEYPEGSEVTVTAAANQGYSFTEWTDNGAFVSAEKDYTFIIERERHLVAHFKEDETEPTVEYQLTISVEGEGSTEPLPGTHSYPDGSIVNLNALPAAGWEFVKWVIGDSEVISEQTSVTMDSDKTATAYFIESGTEPPPEDPAELNVTVVTDREVYIWNSWAYITVTVTDENDKVVPGAEVSVTVSYPGGGTAGSYSGTTDSNGSFAARYRVANRSPEGVYSINAVAVLNDLQGTGSATFTVKQR